MASNKDVLAAKLYEPLLGSLLKGLRQDVWSLVGQHMEAACEEQMPQAPRSLLDCCSGAGGFLQLGVQQNRLPYATLLGLDACFPMVQAAQKRAEQALWIQGDALALPLATKSVSLSTLCMALHTLQEDKQLAIVKELLRVSHRVIVADYCLAQRNISVPAAWLAHGIEFCVGGEHYACYKAFMRRGGLDGFLYAHGLAPVQRCLTLGGAGLVVVLQA